ncbi:MAG: D-alanyl-D-alanine carboxypeptidase, partial [Roseicyclus sp.]
SSPRAPAPGPPPAAAAATIAFAAPPGDPAAIDEAVAHAMEDAPPTAGDAAPPPEPEDLALVVPQPLPRPEPEVVTRASSTGSRLFGVSLGSQPSHHAAERLLLRTALAELGTFDDALRRVVQRGGGYEARFAGMTEEQAARACARLSARSMACETFGP